MSAQCGNYSACTYHTYHNSTRYTNFFARILLYSLVLSYPQEYQGSVAVPGNPGFIKKIMAGPMVEENDKFMVGSFFLVEATREEAQTFVDNDPFNKASLCLVTIGRKTLIMNLT